MLFFSSRSEAFVGRNKQASFALGDGPKIDVSQAFMLRTPDIQHVVSLDSQSRYGHRRNVLVYEYIHDQPVGSARGVISSSASTAA